MLLKFQMNYPMEKPQLLPEISVDLKVNEKLFNEYQEGWDYKNRIEYKILDTQRRLRNWTLRTSLLILYPSLRAFANLGYSTQSPDIGGIFKTNTQASATME